MTKPTIVTPALEEIKKVFNEGLELERQGRLDEVAKEKIEKRLNQISEDVDHAIAKKVAEIEALTAPKPPSMFMKVVASIIVLALLGVILELTFGERFVFAYGDQYKTLAPSLFALTLPFFAILYSRERQSLFSSSQTWLFRWFVLFPSIVLLTSVAVVISPLGWAAFAGWMIGSDAPPRQATFASIETMSASKRGCRQHGTLKTKEAEFNVCLDGLIAKPGLKEGDSVLLNGRDSNLGFVIEQITPAPH